MALVSAIIPTYNRAEAVERAVVSCLAQSHRELEVLVCDDGSTDGTEARIKALDDPRVRWVPGPHAGRPAVPRNRGIALAKGNWLAFLDSDDTWLPSKLERQLEQLERTGNKACCTNALRITPSGTSAGPYFNAPSSTFGLDELLEVNRVICSSSLVERGLVVKVGGFPEAPELKALEDYALWLRQAAFTRFDYLEEPLVHYADVPSESLRAGSVSVAAQRDAVLSDLRRSAAFTTFTPAQRRAITGQLRRARRYAGRPLTQWLFLR